MDILFPWRKQQIQPQFQDGVDASGYHSLPHPQEHDGHYNGGGGGPATRQMMRSFATTESGMSQRGGFDRSGYQSQRGGFNQSGYQSQRGFDQGQSQRGFDESGYNGQSQRGGFDQGQGQSQRGNFDESGPSQRNLSHLDSFRTESQRLFEGDGFRKSQTVPTKAPSVSASAQDGYSGNEMDDADAYGESGRSFGGGDGNMDNTANAYGESGRSFGDGYDNGVDPNGNGGHVGASTTSGPRFRPPVGLDVSNRSQTSDLTDRTPGGRPRGGGMPRGGGYQGGQYEPDLNPVQENPNTAGEERGERYEGMFLFCMVILGSDERDEGRYIFVGIIRNGGVEFSKFQISGVFRWNGFSKFGTHTVGSIYRLVWREDGPVKYASFSSPLISARGCVCIISTHGKTRGTGCSRPSVHDGRYFTHARDLSFFSYGTRGKLFFWHRIRRSAFLRIYIATKIVLLFREGNKKNP